MRTFRRPPTAARDGWVRAFAACALLASACTGGSIGDPCEANGDCEVACETGDNFPGGICTQPCDADTDCPEGWSCISKRSGICMERCASTEACRDRYGSAWECDTESREEGSGDVRVCIGADG